MFHIFEMYARNIVAFSDLMFAIFFVDSFLVDVWIVFIRKQSTIFKFKWIFCLEFIPFYCGSMFHAFDELNFELRSLLLF